DHAGVAATVGDAGSQVGEPRTDVLGHRGPVQAIRLRPRGELLEQPLSLGRAALEYLADWSVLEEGSHPRPAVGQVTGGCVELAIGAVLRRMKFRLIVGHLP